MLTFTFENLPAELAPGLARLCQRLGVCIDGEGIPVRVTEGSGIRVALSDGRAQITYEKKHHFFRAVGLLAEHAAEKESFDISETPQFDTVSFMIDASASVLTTDTIKRYLDFMAMMGLNMVMMYTEDTYKIEGRPYFGYMRGGYTFEELRECDAYAAEYGIEMIPCIQTYGHMVQYLKWQEAAPVKDTDSVLLADEEATYEFIDEMIRTASAPFRSKRIHIGMDESHDMGRGVHLTKHGTYQPTEMFMRHLGRVVEITNKYGLVPMMWSDMFFRVAAGPDAGYYDEETVIPQEVIDSIPKEVQLVYWHYGECPGADSYMLDKHLGMGRDVIFAGAVWAWSGHFPENYYTREATEAALSECKKRNLREIMITMWCPGDGSFDAALLGLQLFAEHTYHETVSTEHLRKRFEFCTGASYDAFMDMSQYHNDFDNGKAYFWNDRFEGKQLLWQDVMEGVYDDFLFRQPMSGHYGKYAEKFRAYTAAEKGEWKELYDFAATTFDCLSMKCFIAERLKPAYDAGDKAFLKAAAAEYFPALLIKIEKMHAQNRKLYLKEKKVFGWSVQDMRYGMLKARIQTAIERIEAYVSGEINALPELAEKRLPTRGSAFRNYLDIALATRFAK